MSQRDSGQSVPTQRRILVVDDERTIAESIAARLRGLSADAVPELDRLPAQLRECALADIAERLRDRPDGWREYNPGSAGNR